MSNVLFPCVSCQRQLSFDQTLVDSIQQCPYCYQRVIVPELKVSDSSTQVLAPPTSQPQVQHIAVPVTTPMPLQPQPQTFRQQERQMEVQTAHKLRMGAGCFAMLAVIFAVGLVGIGIGKIFNLNSDTLLGICLVVAGLAGVAAFVYFGYIATETASTSRGSDRT